MFNFNKKKQESGGEEVCYPLLPLRDVVVFPSMVVPLFVGRDKSIKALEYAMSHEKEVFLAAQRDAKVDIPGQKDIYTFGTMGMVLQLLRLPDGTVKALIEGKQRARIESFVPNPDFFMVTVVKYSEHRGGDAESQALMRAVVESFEEYAKHNDKISKDLVTTIASLEDPARLFNSSLDGNARRAIDIHEGEEVDESAFKALVRQAVALNRSGKSKPSKKANS